MRAEEKQAQSEVGKKASEPVAHERLFKHRRLDNSRNTTVGIAMNGISGWIVRRDQRQMFAVTRTVCQQHGNDRETQEPDGGLCRGPNPFHPEGLTRRKDPTSQGCLSFLDIHRAAVLAGMRSDSRLPFHDGCLRSRRHRTLAENHQVDAESISHLPKAGGKERLLYRHRDLTTLRKRRENALRLSMVVHSQGQVGAAHRLGVWDVRCHQFIIANRNARMHHAGSCRG